MTKERERSPRVWPVLTVVTLSLAMQLVLLAAQNEVSGSGLAAVTSGVAFFRSLGGAVGV